MKVWRKITLVIWVIVLSLCTAVILVNYALQTSVLNPQKSKTWLAESNTYETLRDTVLTQRVVDAVNQQYPDNKLIDQQLVALVLRETLPKEQLATRADAFVNDAYRWLDSKAPDVRLNVSFEDKRDQLYRSLEVQLRNRIIALPACDGYRYPPEEALLEDLCLPDYVTAGEATQAIMGGIRSSQLPLSTDLTEETTDDTTNYSGIKRIPTYLNYVWVLNLVAIAVYVFVALLVLASRRIVGLIALGIGLVAGGVLTMTLQTKVAHIALPAGGEFQATIQAAFAALMPHMSASANLLGLISIITGLFITAGASFWYWRQRSVGS